MWFNFQVIALLSNLRNWLTDSDINRLWWKVLYSKINHCIALSFMLSSHIKYYLLIKMKMKSGKLGSHENRWQEPSSEVEFYKTAKWKSARKCGRYLVLSVVERQDFAPILNLVLWKNHACWTTLFQTLGWFGNVLPKFTFWRALQGPKAASFMRLF